MTHRYAIGQILEMRAAPRTSTRVAGPCEVVFRLPHDRGPVLYRVRPLNQTIERVVDEIDLSPSTVEKSDTDSPPLRSASPLPPAAS